MLSTTLQHYAKIFLWSLVGAKKMSPGFEDYHPLSKPLFIYMLPFLFVSLILLSSCILHLYIFCPSLFLPLFVLSSFCLHSSFSAFLFFWWDTFTPISYSPPAYSIIGYPNKERKTQFVFWTTSVMWEEREGGRQQGEEVLSVTVWGLVKFIGHKGRCLGAFTYITARFVSSYRPSCWPWVRKAKYTLYYYFDFDQIFWSYPLCITLVFPSAISISRLLLYKEYYPLIQPCASRVICILTNALFALHLSSVPVVWDGLNIVSQCILTVSGIHKSQLKCSSLHVNAYHHVFA